MLIIGFAGIVNDMNQNAEKILLVLADKIKECDRLVFDSSGFFLEGWQKNLAEICRKYETLLAVSGTSYSRPRFQFQVTTYNSPSDISALLDSLEVELAAFGFPAGNITIRIIDDSDKKEAIESNRLLVKKVRPFNLIYYGAEEQKKFISEFAGDDATVFDSLLNIVNKTKDDFESDDPSEWGHKGVAGAMNMAFLISREYADQFRMTISLDEDMTFGVYVKVKGEDEPIRIKREHAYSYFHRLCSCLEDADYDCLLASSVGDYCTPSLTWRVVHSLSSYISEYGFSNEALRSFVDSFPVHDGISVQNIYAHRDRDCKQVESCLSKRRLGMVGDNTSGNHMLLSAKLLKEMDFCYYGPGRVADARFFLAVQNLKQFKYVTETSLVMSHTKRSDDPSHILSKELAVHVHDEIMFTGYAFVLYTFLDHPDIKDLFSGALLRKEIFAELKKALASSDICKQPVKRDLYSHYEAAVAEFADILDENAIDDSLQSAAFDVLDQLKDACNVILQADESRGETVLDGIDLFYQALRVFKDWKKCRSFVANA